MPERMKEARKFRENCVTSERFLHSTMDFIEKESLIEKGDRILLSLSAGKDSMALFQVIKQLADNTTCEFAVFHLNHGMRGKESDDDEEFLRTLCSQTGIEYFCEKADFKETTSFEERARNMRYEMLKRTAENKSYNKIATAHTLSDSIETVLMRIATGTHVRGLEGIPIKRGLIIRPLLWATSEQIYDFLKTNNIVWREDASNLDTRYSRNYIRHTVIPQLKTVFARADQCISDISSAARSNNKTVHTLMKHAGLDIQYSESYVKVINHSLLLDEDIFSVVISDIIHYFSLYCSAKKISEIRKRFLSNKKRIVIYNHPKCEIIKDFRDGKGFIYATIPQNLTPTRWDLSIIYKNENVEIKGSEMSFPLRACVLDFENVQNHLKENDAIYVSIDRDCVINVRSKKSGDAIVCGGKKRTLKDMMIDNKCSMFEKKTLPVFEIDSEIVAVGFGLIERGMNRISDNRRVGVWSKKVLAITRHVSEN
jgi:tRNA(Ile)-lysidine synthase